MAKGIVGKLYTQSEGRTIYRIDSIIGRTRNVTVLRCDGHASIVGTQTRVDDESDDPLLEGQDEQEIEITFTL